MACLGNCFHKWLMNLKMNWITNHPKPLKGLWPRRIGCEYIEGEPRATEECSVEILKEQGLIGVYVDMPLDKYFKLPVVRSPREIAILKTVPSTPPETQSA